jgi:hypothetical protein
MSWYPDDHPEKYLKEILLKIKEQEGPESFYDLDKGEVRSNPTWAYAIIMDNLIKDLSLTPRTYLKVDPQELLKCLSPNGKKYLDYYSIDSSELKLDIKRYVFESKLQENKKRNMIIDDSFKNYPNTEKDNEPKTAEELVSDFGRLIG